MITHKFDPDTFLRDNYSAGPVAFFKAGEYTAGAQKLATNLYKTIVAKIADDETYPEAQTWAKDVLDYDFIVLQTEDVQEHWLKTSQRDRMSNELRMHNTHATSFAEEYPENSSTFLRQKDPTQAYKETEVTLKAESTDRVYVNDSCDSVGYTIKKVAAERYYVYHTSDTSIKAVISLGINGILDLGNTEVDSQRLYFDDNEWARLLEAFPPPECPQHCVADNNLFLEYAKQIEKEWSQKNYNLVRLMAAKFEYQSKGDIATACHLYQDYINFWQYHEYALTSSGPTLSKMDYIIKIWGNLLETVFRSSSLRCTWEEDQVVSQGVSAYNTTFIKSDFSILDQSGQKFSAGAFVHSLPTEMNASADRIKLLIEGKGMLNGMVKNGVKTVFLLLVVGIEAKVLSLSLVADGLYIAHDVCRIVLPKSIAGLHRLKSDIIPALFQYRVCLSDISHHQLFIHWCLGLCTQMPWYSPRRS
ncbi:hypothetical protein BJV82DRAFT_611465 [Fennellomyces sp. T-0311]|nr:hypothetical protein BJV82DRAFT_611465 [Fennellomyces sp. T-0311]